MKLFLCKLIFTCAAVAEPEVTPRAELVYGTVLYDYYQENFTDALLQVRVAQEQGHTEGAETRFKLAEGSFAFSAEMFDYATETFASVEPAELTEIDNLRLAFHMSREHFRVGDWVSLSETLNQIELGSTRFFGRKRFHPEVEFMRSELALVSGNYAKAREHLEILDKNDVYRTYGLYNLGGALRAAGDLSGAQEAFDQITRGKPKTEEAFDLQQRALLASAFLQRENGETVAAEKILGGLPAEGRYRDLALASFGSLAMESGDYELAARVWLKLQQQPLWTPSTASARLGFPLSLENLEREDLALTHYRAAEQSFSLRAAKLTELSSRADDTEWVRDLLAVFAEGRSNPELLEEWQEQLGHTDWLEWLSAESVDSLLAQWRDLRKTRAWLAELPADLETYEELAVEQRRRARAVRAALADDGLTARHETLETQIDERLEQLERLREETPSATRQYMEQLATPEQQKRLERLDRMYAVSEQLDAEAADKWRERLDRLRGVVFWEITDARPVVLQQMRAAIAEAEALSASMLAQASRLQAAEAGLQAGVLADFSEFSQRARALTARVDRALFNREEQLARELKRGMQRESEQVQKYLLTARVAIARTLDQYAAIDGVEP